MRLVLYGGLPLSSASKNQWQSVYVRRYFQTPHTWLYENTEKEPARTRKILSVMQRSEKAVQTVVRVWVLIVILAPAENYIWLKNGKAEENGLEVLGSSQGSSLNCKTKAALSTAPVTQCRPKHSVELTSINKCEAAHRSGLRRATSVDTRPRKKVSR